MFRLVFACIVLVNVALAEGAAAQTLHQAVEGAWALDPQIKALDAGRNEFIAREGAASAFFPAPPAITLGNATDQVIRDRHQRAMELELSTPLWLPGEGTATRQVARADLSRTDARLALARLSVAGKVREAVFAYELAARKAGLDEHRVQDAKALEADVARRARAGEVASFEQDLARGELFTAQAAALEQQAQAAAARTTLLSLTGLRAPPAAFEERPVPDDADIARHPRLQAAERGIDAARAALRLVGIATRDSPEIGVIVTRNQDTFGTQYDTTIGLRLRVPFSNEARNAPRRAAAEAKMVAAQAEYDTAEREIRLDVANARRFLTAAEAERPLVDGRLQANRSTLTRLQGSYNAGEIDLLEVLRARSALFEAGVAQARNRLAIGEAIARINQALGVAP